MKRILLVGIIIILAVILGVVFLPSLIHPRVGNVTMGGVGATGMMAMIYNYGDSKGIFADHGLNVTYVSFTDSYTQILSLVTGKIDLCFTSPGLAAHTLGEGESFRIGMAVALSEQALLTRPEIKTVQDLRGRSLGVIGTTSDSYYITKWWLESKGLDLSSDLQIVEIKNPAGLTSYYTTGQLDAIVIWGSFAKAVKDSGGVVLVTQTECMEDLINHPYYVPLALLSDELVDSKPSISKNLMRAFRDIAEEIEMDKEEAVRYLSEQTGEPSEAIMANLDVTLIGSLDDAVREDLTAYFDYGTERGFFEEAPGQEVYYFDWA